MFKKLLPMYYVDCFCDIKNAYGKVYARINVTIPIQQQTNYKDIDIIMLSRFAYNSLLNKAINTNQYPYIADWMHFIIKPNKDEQINMYYNYKNGMKLELYQ